MGADESGETAYRVCLPARALGYLLGCSEVRNLPDSLGESELEAVAATVSMNAIAALAPEDLTLPRSDCEARGW
eukprot:2332888-Alexandrium_andersonii.AAC.1